LVRNFYKISEENLYILLDRLGKEYKIVGPVKRDDAIFFEYVNDASELVLRYNGRSLLPIKKFFLPPREILFEYEIIDNDVVIRDKLEELQKSRTVIFGARACDITSLEILKKTFSKDFEDPYVLTRTRTTIIIGVMCEDVSPTCFCYQAGSGPVPKESFDIFLYRLGDHYLVQVGSEKGEEIVSSNADLFSKASPEDISKKDIMAEKLIEKMKKLDIPELQSLYSTLTSIYEATLWDEYAKKCLSCGKCNFACPTCYCFDIHDEVDLGLRYGARIREWDSCHFLSFTRVASGEVFRKDRSSRIKQRIYHKLVYSVNDIGITSCVGCGRCIEVCPASIDLREIIKRVMEERGI